MKEKNLFGKLIFGYDKLEEYLLCSSLVLTTIIVFLQVIMRTVVNSSFTWSEELTRYIFIWQIWLGVSIAQRNKQHIKVELIGSIVKNKKIVAIVDVFAAIIMIAFNVFLVIFGFELVGQMISRGTLSGAMRLPMWIVYMALPVSSFVLCLRLIGQIVDDIKKLSAGGEEG